jgi:two-component system, LytTR family, sensor kinase
MKETIGNQKKKSRKINLLFHLLVLSLAVVIDLPRSLASLKEPAELAYYIVTRIFPLIVFYTCYFWLVPAYLAPKKIVVFAILVFLLLNVVTFMGYTILQIMHNAFDGGSFHLIYRLRMHFSGVMAMSVAAGFGTVFRIVTGWFGEMQNARILGEEKLRSELQLLKAQVNPHFLFNTLNNIDSLIRTDQAKASEALIKLSSLLRYVIYDAVKDKVPLKMELEHIEGYIDLQRLRYSRNNSISFEIKGDPEGKMIAPVMFMPFIENAFKHTTSEGIARGLVVGFTIHEDSIDFYCSNYLTLPENTDIGGFGLENVMKRLEIQYPGRYKLQTGSSKEKYITTLTLST